MAPPPSSSAGATGGAGQSSIRIRVLAASTGVTYPISLHPNELTVANIKRHLAGAVPPQDQILLFGPPYKVPRDSTLRSEEVLTALRLGDREDERLVVAAEHGGEGDSDGGGGGGVGGGGTAGLLGAAERTGSKRLFLFSKRALSDSSPDPPPCRLTPSEILLPSVPDPSPVAFPRDPATGALSSPLHQALEVYERRFMLDLCRGRAYADGADLRLASCRTCAGETAVMARALRAAVSNLSDHRNGAARTRTEFAATFGRRSGGHGELLRKFEGCLGALEGMALHPALVAIARRSGRVMETLLDTVPVERERAWAEQCRTAHARLQTLYGDLDGAFGQILGAGRTGEEEAREDLRAEEEIGALACEIETTGLSIRNRQAARLGRLTSNHGEVVRVITNAISEGNNGGGAVGPAGGSVQAAFTSLEDVAKSSADILPSMESDDAQLQSLMIRVADVKTHAMKRMKLRLRQVSVAQSAIQRVISNVAVVRDALSQQSENVVHLEHVSELPQSYRDFLAEIRRRRAFGDAVTSTSEAVMERLAALRGDETKRREKFLRGAGRHLMPAFFEMFAPTLTTPPPLFTPQMPALVEMDSLPDVGPPPEEDGGGEGGGGRGSSSLGSTTHGAANESPIQRPISTAEGQGGVSSASTLTDGSQPPAAAAQQQQQGGGGAIEAEQAQTQPESKGGATMTMTTTTTTPAGGGRGGGGGGEQLIVSAENDDVIMDTACTDEDDDGRGGGGGRGGHEKRTAADAERKTLAYENAVLRQVIERMGGKTPRKYVDEANERDREEERERRRREAEAATKAREELDAADRELGALRKELAEAKGKLATTTAAATAAAAKSKSGQKEGGKSKQGRRGGGGNVVVDDRISHSSFEIGDVGLFMPTGLTMMKGGKRTYLAFHTNCPHRYLSTDNIEGTPDYVLGRIIYQEELYAGPMGTDSNPYGLHVGTKFWVLTVEMLNVPI